MRHFASYETSNQVRQLQSLGLRDAYTEIRPADCSLSIVTEAELASDPTLLDFPAEYHTPEVLAWLESIYAR